MSSNQFNSIFVDGPLHQSLSVDIGSAQCDERDASRFYKDRNCLSQDYLNALDFPGVPPHKLTFKVGMPLLIIRNLNFDAKLVNGQRGLLLKVSSLLLTVRLHFKDGTTDDVDIPRKEFTFDVKGMRVVRRQFPVLPAYAKTINKEQGQEEEVLGLDLRDDVFSHGQLYVAVGRAHAQSAVTVLTTRHRMYGGRAHAANVVFPELLPTGVPRLQWSAANARAQVERPPTPLPITIVAKDGTTESDVLPASRRVRFLTEPTLMERIFGHSDS